MLNHFIADFPTLLQSAEATLLKMKTRLDAYKKRPDANPEQVERMEKELLDLVRFTQACKTFKQQSEAAQDAIYRQGIQRGLELAAEEERHEVSPHWKRNHHPDRDVNRYYHNYTQMMKWSDHL